jgi:hypothetical protein
VQTRVRFIVDKRGGCCKVEVFLFGYYFGPHETTPRRMMQGFD